MVLGRVGRAKAKPTIYAILVGFALARPTLLVTIFDLCIRMSALAWEPSRDALASLSLGRWRVQNGFSRGRGRGNLEKIQFQTKVWTPKTIGWSPKL